MLSCAQLDACLTVEALNNTDTVVSVLLSVSKGDKRMSAFSVHVFAETQNRRNGYSVRKAIIAFHLTS